MYKRTLNALDEDIRPYEQIVTHIPDISKYRNEYISAGSPREFIQKMREKYTTKYCFEIGGWLSRYAENIGINYFKQNWFIDINDVEKPDKYELFLTDAPIRGGMIRRRKTYKSRNKRKTVGGGHGCVGYYETFEY